jgi:hypothetical protein
VVVVVVMVVVVMVVVMVVEVMVVVTHEGYEGESEEVGYDDQPDEICLEIWETLPSVTSRTTLPSSVGNWFCQYKQAARSRQ